MSRRTALLDVSIILGVSVAYVALIPVGLSTLLLGGGLVAWAAVHGLLIIGGQIGALLALYPAWALVQQLAFQGILHRRLMLLLDSRVLQVAITAAAFAAVHVGNWALVLLTFSVGILWSLLYRAVPNLWLLAASHTVLAALACPLLLGDAPLSRL